tara:strand:+ start:17939 stop:18154 length:216 start_codon:yes stop_codon:yes gene_type:complete
MDSRKRSILKTITFRIIATLTTMALVLLFTKDLAIAGLVGALEFVSKLIIYYLHERIWCKINWGKKLAVDE